VNVRSPPSTPSASLTDNSVETAGVVSAIVPVPVASLMPTPGGRPPAGADRVTVNVSSPSTRSSATAATANVWDSAAPVAFAAKVRLPLALSKSDSDAVSSGPMAVA